MPYLFALDQALVGVRQMTYTLLQLYDFKSPMKLFFFLFTGLLASGTGAKEATDNAEVAKEVDTDDEMNLMRNMIEQAVQKKGKNGTFHASEINEHDRIKKLEEEYSRRLGEIKLKQAKKKAQEGKGGGGGRDRSKEYQPASDMELFERTPKEQRGKTYVVAEFDLLDEDEKPEIYEQFTMLLRPRSLECFGVYLEPGYQAEVSMESRNGEVVNGNMRSPDGKIVAKLKTIDEIKNWGTMFVQNMPRGHYQICAFNFQGMAHVSQLKIEILVEFDEMAKRKHFEQRHEELEHMIAEAGLAPEAAGKVTKEDLEFMIQADQVDNVLGSIKRTFFNAYRTIMHSRIHYEFDEHLNREKSEMVTRMRYTFDSIAKVKLTTFNLLSFLGCLVMLMATVAQVYSIRHFFRDVNVDAGKI